MPCRRPTALYPLIPTLLVLACGCGGSIRQQFKEQTSETFDDQARLLVAVEAFRIGRGRWPTSPQELQSLSEVLGFERYENLRFEPLPDGGLAVRFDRWHRRDGSVGMSTAGLELPPPTGDDSARNAQTRPGSQEAAE
jgi:hypothetical protein